MMIRHALSSFKLFIMRERDYAKHIKHLSGCICGRITAQGRNMRPHVTLVNPPYPKDAHQHPPFTPLGLGYLGAVLEKNQYEVDVIDCPQILI